MEMRSRKNYGATGASYEFSALKAIHFYHYAAVVVVVVVVFGWVPPSLCSHIETHARLNVH